tara:strand:- start:2799 stop:2990 length:192 start_codon:yes stop_codon:yes gene_type:complete
MSIVIVFAAAADGADANLSSKFCVSEAFTALKLDINMTSTLTINLKTNSLLSKTQFIPSMIWK